MSESVRPPVVSPLATAAYHGTVALMMVCITYIGLQVAQRFIPQWDGSYLLGINLFVTLETMFALRLASRSQNPVHEWLLITLTQWVIILIGVKALLYLWNQPAQILRDVLEWDENFFASFFTLEYSIAILCAFFTWLLSGLFCEFWNQVSSTSEQLDLERQGVWVKDRAALRRGLVTAIFNLGILLMVAGALSRLEAPFLPPVRLALRSSIPIALLAYFLLGLILLAQTQYTILNARWYLQNIPVAAPVAPRWLRYSVVLIVLAALVAGLLPTHYSFGLLDLINGLLRVVAGLLVILQFLLAIPFLWIIYQVSRLLGLNAGAPPISGLPEMPSPIVASEPDLWFQMLKSLAFWTVFFFGSYFAIRHYLRQRSELLETVRQIPLIIWLRQFWARLKNRFQLVRRQARTLIRTRLDTLRRRTRLPALPDLTPLFTHLPPRQQILLTYQAMLRWSRDHALPRRPDQTPYEYAHLLQTTLPDSQNEIETLTALFMEARYTRHTVDTTQANEAHLAWQKLRHNAPHAATPLTHP